eukprot:403360676
MGCSCTKDAAAVKQPGDKSNRSQNYIVKNPDQKNAQNPQKPTIDQKQNINDKPVQKQQVNDKKIVEQSKNEDKKDLNRLQTAYKSQQKETLKDIYMNPGVIVEMAFNDYKRFKQVIKENGILNFSTLYGYEVPEEFQILKSGRKISTLYWNILTFALVYNRPKLLKFLLTHINFNLVDLLDIEKYQNQQNAEPYINSNGRYVQDIQPILKLMLENESPLIRNLFNELAYLINPKQNQQILSLIIHNSQPQVNIEILLQSQFFKQLYYQKVKGNGDSNGKNYKHSFRSFYERYLKIFESDKQAMEIISKQLSLSPYAAGFGIYVNNNIKEAKDKFGNLQQIVQTCQKEIRDYDLWKQGDIKEEEIQEIISNIKRVYLQSSDQKPLIDFCNSLKSRQLQLSEKIIKSFSSLWASIQNGDQNAIKNKVGLYLPLEDLLNITGYDGEKVRKEQISFEIGATKELYEVFITKLNPLELSFVYQQTKLVRYFIQDLNLKSYRDLRMNKKEDLVSQMEFLVVPILKKNKELLEILLDLDHLWVYEDLKEICNIIKLAQWPQGIQVVLESKAANVIFAKLNLKDRFRFVRDFLALPFKLQQVDESPDKSMNSSRQSISLRERNALKPEEKIQMLTLIKTCLTQSPYTAAYLFQEFAQRRDTYKDQIENDPIADDPAQNLQFFKKAVDNVNTLELSEFIFETQGQILKHMETALNMVKMQGTGIESKGDEHLNEMAKQIEFLIGKILIHPTYCAFTVDGVFNEDVSRHQYDPYTQYINQDNRL